MTSNGAVQFSLMNALRTGNMVLDMLICLLIPLVLNVVVNAAKKVDWKMNGIKDLLTQRGHMTIRHIEYIKRINTFGTVADVEQKNHILQKAVALFIGRNRTTLYKTARVELLDGETFQPNAKATAPSVSALQQLEQLKIHTLPPLDSWVQIEPHLWFRQTVKGLEGNVENGTKTTGMTESVVVYSLKQTHPDLNAAEQQQAIDSFLARAYQYYVSQIRKHFAADTSRYMYILWNTEGRDVKLYKRYRLGEHKTFSSLFFDQKEPLMNLLQKFMKQEGKFAIPGFPHKLGLLLHGPPGTGKTSLIKAIAHHTKRHVVSISLAKIQTNQELMDLMFDRVFRVQSEDIPAKLQFEQIVFVMEDVDCATDVVQSRQGEQTQNETERLNDRDQALQPVQDKLNLSGLLNVLDGVVDSPNRVVIMTSNHPEKLDPALIRPGRINKQIMLGYMNPRQMQLMLEHYFDVQLTADELTRLETFDPSKNVTPAYVEQLCAEYDTISELLDVLL